ncbi:hypothetical protein BN7_6148 [Wickerhamomyces ciferrii]|uniref:Pre-mRNA-splicing factor CWC26 n=1 Tax=Wickerhamomyces ciferrii (strain ATCC 14091 / BCRC 22168 / CBS 111 / JCM 3599 / NBRC 0793 / NRRL Y-1031 F-60-10) TaxID=1206466 RepID=K0KMP7_WICCF|nr:uncharacterized protein BN7_6148 [Wickerhamomyces ciferrii]CCH46555.1 hypothetical protein BN7_6148 [Wickerhamomyces ciferrii]
MSLSDYLAKNYLTDTKKKSKKPKKEKKGKQENSVIVENQISLKKNETNEEIDDLIDEPTEVLQPPRKKQKAKGWKVVGTNELVTDLPPTEREEVKMSSGAKAGLQSAEEVSKQIKEKEQKQKQEMEEQRLLNNKSYNETVYRDKSGRKIDMEQQKADAQAREEEEEKIKKIENLKQNMGLVQLLDIQESKDKLDSISKVGMTRHADDQELNEKLKIKEHEDDPLLSFHPTKSKKYVSRTGRKLYKGGFPENRFGIVPGWRWDGVDRSNGFEKSWFKKQAEIQERKTLSYTMQEDY